MRFSSLWFLVCSELGVQSLDFGANRSKTEGHT